MEKYILDTCTWIEFFHERNGVKEHVDVMDPDQICASEISLAELTYGAMNSGDFERHIKEPEWLRQYITIYHISDVFEEYGLIRCALKKIKKDYIHSIGSSLIIILKLLLNFNKIYSILTIQLS